MVDLQGKKTKIKQRPSLRDGHTVSECKPLNSSSTELPLSYFIAAVTTNMNETVLGVKLYFAKQGFLFLMDMLQFVILKTNNSSKRPYRSFLLCVLLFELQKPSSFSKIC